MGTTITLGGVDLGPYKVPGSLKLKGAMGSRAAVSLKLVNTGSYAPVKGSQVLMVDDQTLATRFAGVLYTAKRTKRLGSTSFEWDLTFTDFCQLADRKLVFKTYSSTTSGAIVQDIITTYLAELGVTAGTIEAGSSIVQAGYNGQTCTELLNGLADQDGYIWRIDENKQLHYVSQSGYAAPWNITDSTANYVELSTVDTLAGYRNTEYFRASANGISNSRTETYAGDGVRREFAMLYPLYQVPTIKVNSVAKTVGIQGIDSGKDFYWSKGSKIITQDSAGTLLTGSDTLAVTYVGTIAIFVQLDNGADITARAAAEGNSGRYEVMDQDSNCQYIDLALEAASTQLDQNAFGVMDMEFDTFTPGLVPGMVMSVTRSDYGISTTMLITEVDGSELPAVGLPFKYSVKGISGQKKELWLDYYRKLSQRKDYSIRENEVVSLCTTLQAVCKCTDVISVSSRPIARIGTAQIGACAVW
jgi:hypothetical protein